MNLNVRTIANDVISAGVAALAVLAFALNASSALHIPASWVAYITAAVAVVNGVIGVARRYTVTKIAQARAK